MPTFHLYHLRPIISYYSYGIDSSDIAKVEIVKGRKALDLYGCVNTNKQCIAANGVVLISTHLKHHSTALDSNMLFVIDGVPVEARQLRYTLKYGDIESVSVLDQEKDLSFACTPIQGVVLITTTENHKRAEALKQRSQKNQKAFNTMGVSFKICSNPVGNSLNFECLLEQKERVTASIYTIDGKEIAIIFSNSLSKGTHLIECPIDDLPSGIYLLNLVGNTSKTSKRFVVR